MIQVASLFFQIKGIPIFRYLRFKVLFCLKTYAFIFFINSIPSGNNKKFARDDNTIPS